MSTFVLCEFNEFTRMAWELTTVYNNISVGKCVSSFKHLLLNVNFWEKENLFLSWNMLPLIALELIKQNPSVFRYSATEMI